MTDTALVTNGVVAQVWRNTAIDTINASQHPEGILVAFDDQALVCGMVWDGRALTQPTPRSPDVAAYAATKRYAVEVGGVAIAGIAMPTDRDTQAKLTAAFLLSQVNPTTTFSWKTAAGFVTLTAVQITQIAVAVGAFVQSAYATEAVVQAAIVAGGITTTAQIDAAAWPKNA